MARPLAIRLLGELVLARGDEPVSLPPSRRTRALLAYLVANAKPHRRDRLCALFWELPDDPRGALRWSLSRLRSLIDDPDRVQRLVANRETVAFDPADARVDIVEVRRLASDPATATTDDLRAAAALFRGPFLEGLDLSDCHEFRAWCIAEREDWRTLHARLRAELVRRLAPSAPAEALEHARVWATIDPGDEAAHAGLVEALFAAGRRDEAAQQHEASLRQLGELGTECRGVLRRVWLDATGDGPAHEEAANQPRTTADEAPSPDEATPVADRPVPATLALPERPSLAVLPFTNLSGNREEDFISDGLAEEILIKLATFRWFFVISRASSFSYRGTAVTARQVGRELGVRYIVEGTVRRAGDRIRVTVQLTDTTDDHVVWSARYDREFTDIFALEDEIADRIIHEIEPEMAAAERQRARRREPDSLDAWTAFQRGLWHLFRFTGSDFDEARNLFRRAIEADPEFACAHGELSYVSVVSILLGYSRDWRADLEIAAQAAERAVELDPGDCIGHFAQGRVLVLRHDFENAIAAMERSLARNPNSARGYYGLGIARLYSGRPEDALEPLLKAIRLSPRDPNLWAHYYVVGRAHFIMGRFEEALRWTQRAMTEPNAHYWPRVHAAASLALLDRLDEARAVMAAIDPAIDLSPAAVTESLGLYGPHSGVERLIDALRQVGVPA